MGDWKLRTDNFLGHCWHPKSRPRVEVDPGGVVEDRRPGESVSLWALRGPPMVSSPKNTFYDQSRDLTILGDPTLRMHVLPADKS